MDYIFPRLLKKGDRIGILAPCGALREPERIDIGIKRLREAGFDVVLSKHLFDNQRYLAGNDSIRAEEINKFFEDDRINCIMCARGGYGAIRIIDKLDYGIIRRNPKIFCGYSDVTALSVMMLKTAGLVTFSSPMLSGDFGSKEVSEFTISSFFKTVSGEGSCYDLQGDSNIDVSGIAWGGNLTTIASLCGMDFIPDKGFLFIIEDINEPAYKIDRAFAQLSGIKEFRKNICGIVCGEFTNIDNSEWLMEVLDEYAQTLRVPLWRGLRLGHSEDKITFPVGGNCKISNNKIFFYKGLDAGFCFN